MSFRRGGGRGGRGRGGFSFGKQQKFELFPEIKDENLGKATMLTERRSLALSYVRLKRYWNSSAYFLSDETDVSNKTESMDIERYSDMNSDRSKAKPPLSDFILITPDYFPAELVKAERKTKRPAKRVRWTQEVDLQKLDVFEKLEQKGIDQDEKKTEDEDDEEGEENSEEDEESSDNGDYDLNPDIDDDEDDFNMDEGDVDEATYE
ncbi:unnamed protein product [Cuscuta epithymum]|uniref:DNA-directed RNA polymerase III subunit n=1 Tax=Cuscuta epithymum TaxID=186058 RepID=A0AAV0DEU8_9ASTE|nr:unnamed protein product [Cuscuta epithymum]